MSKAKGRPQFVLHEPCTLSGSSVNMYACRALSHVSFMYNHPRGKVSLFHTRPDNKTTVAKTSSVNDKKPSSPHPYLPFRQKKAKENRKRKENKQKQNRTSCDVLHDEVSVRPVRPTTGVPKTHTRSRPVTKVLRSSCSRRKRSHVKCWPHLIIMEKMTKLLQERDEQILMREKMNELGSLLKRRDEQIKEVMETERQIMDLRHKEWKESRTKENETSETMVEARQSSTTETEPHTQKQQTANHTSTENSIAPNPDANEVTKSTWAPIPLVTSSPTKYLPMTDKYLIDKLLDYFRIPETSHYTRQMYLENILLILDQDAEVTGRNISESTDATRDHEINKQRITMQRSYKIKREMYRNIHLAKIAKQETAEKQKETRKADLQYQNNTEQEAKEIERDKQSCKIVMEIIEQDRQNKKRDMTSKTTQTTENDTKTKKKNTTECFSCNGNHYIKDCKHPLQEVDFTHVKLVYRMNYHKLYGHEPDGPRQYTTNRQESYTEIDYDIHYAPKYLHNTLRKMNRRHEFKCVALHNTIQQMRKR
jgi:hypothetical protein